MEYTKLYLYINEEFIEIAISMMIDIGITGFEIENSSEFKSFINQENKYWDYIDENVIKKFEETEPKIIIYLPKNNQGIQKKEKLKEIVNKLFENYNINVRIKQDSVKEEDWENNWKEYFKPFKIGENFVIKPSWENYLKKGREKVIEIDPGSSFGTGQHSSTKLCLEAIEKYVKQGYNIIDMGCGSGILSIASLLMKAKYVLALDIDENCVKITNENLTKNLFDKASFDAIKVEPIMDSKTDRLISSLNCDIIVANIVSDILINLSDNFYRYLSKGKKLISSGIIEERENQVIQTFIKSGFSICEIKRENGWVCIIAEIL